MGWFPCECCGGQCDIFDDTFDRADAATLGGDWDERSGTWNIDTNEAETGDSNAVAIVDMDHPDAADSHVVVVDFVADDNGDQVRLICTWDNDNQYLFAEAEVGATSGTLRLYERIGGVNTLIDDETVNGLVPNTLHRLEICFDGVKYARAKLTVNVGGGSGFAYAFGPSLITGGDRVGIATGAVSTSVQFNNFDWERHGLDTDFCELCAVLPCDPCVDDEAPTLLSVTISGVTNVSCTGNNCTDMNGTFILEWGELFGIDCYWVKTGIAPVCGRTPTTTIAAWIDLVAGNTYELRVQILFPAPAARTWNFRDTRDIVADGPFECLTWSDRDVPYDNGINDVCDFSGATVEITAA